MKKLCLFAFLLLSTPALAGGSAAVFLSDKDGSQGLSPNTLLELVRGALAAERVPVCRPPSAPRVLPSASELATVLKTGGCSRVFVVSALALGRKRVVSLQELHPKTGVIVRGQRMSAKSLEELDLIVPRLVRTLAQPSKAAMDFNDDAAGQQRSIPQGMPRPVARIDDVTEEEARPWRKKDGDMLFGIGIPVGSSLQEDAKVSYGLGGIFAYEMERARIDAVLTTQFNTQGDHLGHGALTLGGAYFFNKRNISPYAAASIGYGGTWLGGKVGDGDFGLVGSVGGGVEFFRLYKARMLLDLRLTVPSYQIAGETRPVITGLIGFLLARR